MRPPRFREVDVSDPRQSEGDAAFDGRMVTLLLGDQNFGVRYQNFLRQLSRDRADACPDASTSGFAAGRSHYGGGSKSPKVS